MKPNPTPPAAVDAGFFCACRKRIEATKPGIATAPTLTASLKTLASRRWVPGVLAALWLASPLASTANAAGTKHTGAAHATHSASSRATTAAADPSTRPLTADDARYLLTRTGYSPDARELAPFVGLTRAQAVDRLLEQTRRTAVTPPPVWVSDPPLYGVPVKNMTDAQRRELNERRNRMAVSLAAWWAQEMASTPSPLTERMTMFWHNHFVSSDDKVREPVVLYRQNVLLRANALGNFGVLLHEVSKDPAMLIYLDGAGSRKGRPNENFAREVMELFTLGEGHYTEQDVREAARAYTGWSIDRPTMSYVWRANVHDTGTKTVLNQTGDFDGDQMLDILLARPETATFVTGKLWREFVSPTPDPAQVQRVAGAFRASGYDIRVALRALLLSPAFWDARTRGTLVKSPSEFVTDTVREFDIGYDDPQMLAQQMRVLGQDLFRPPNVKGWPGGDAWIDSTTLLARKQFVERMFRATENANSGGPSMMSPSLSANPAVQRAALRPAAAMPRTVAGVRFDLSRWLQPYALGPVDIPDAASREALQRAVLPFAPAAPQTAGENSAAYLQALLMDPAYQLK
ncbi:DUF1800 domain-containing protein [Pandoraea apista]|uniref:DUF1800 domain-containing protein n=1 Tax=Pandoraea apista TaxID=93218 RepID=UPI00065A0147|nr:DUF1800 domain-containing protein [Pandoraea apista]ALS64578.1 hypothetical protein AT395_05905 [Pandoraea apista]RRW89441.1 DUF1800 domain-containing protein [Pandoraea apista]RRW99715.1 DUF1800 domain-containing protein [Pandoraea apista]CFB64523.1 hypothetical protein LMG16407_04379 [Pandoraea apista]